MNVFYSDIEAEIVSHLSVIENGGGVDVVQLPSTQEEFARPFAIGRVTVAYKSSDFGDPKSPYEIAQDEAIHIEIVIQSRGLRGATGLHAITEAVKRRVLGFRPTDCSKMFLIKNGFTEHNPDTGLWAYSMVFQTKYVLVEDKEYNTEPALENVIFEYNEQNPSIPPIPFPGTYPSPPVIAYKGDVAYWDGEVWRRLHPGEPGYVLATMGNGEVPEWVSPQSGPQGPQGATGPQGPQGPTGATGAQGPQGLTGPQGPQGLTGPQGPQGPAGANGANGSSAYQVAVANGFVGTEAQWLASLVGPQGPTGAAGATGATGPQGPAGPNQIAIGTTTITGGTQGRILFQGAGGVVQQAAGIFWDAPNNRFGIGTTSPLQPLHVVGRVLLEESLYIGTGGATNNQIVINATGSLAGIYSPSYSSGSTNIIQFKDFSGVESMRLTAARNLLLGTTTDSGFKADINGTLRVQNQLSLGVSGTAGRVNFARQSDGAIIGSIYTTGGMLAMDNAAGTIEIRPGSLTGRFGFLSTGNMVVSSTGALTDAASALFSMVSTTKGFLLPRMTTTQKNAIASPAEGLEVFDTTLKQKSYYNGTTWINI